MRASRLPSGRQAATTTFGRPGFKIFKRPSRRKYDTAARGVGVFPVLPTAPIDVNGRARDRR